MRCFVIIVWFGLSNLLFCIVIMLCDFGVRPSPPPPKAIRGVFKVFFKVFLNMFLKIFF